MKGHLTCSNRYLLGNHSPSYHSQSCAQTVSNGAAHCNSKWILRIKNKKRLYAFFFFYSFLQYYQCINTAVTKRNKQPIKVKMYGLYLL